ncbi:peptide ABC transporter substrate-binding protein [Mesorhizobium amorphae]|uniref:ABC transporter substrate-binding protein n=1 Tax=Mesorhizobium amorphae TaxID=71433 RepID=UPI00235CCB35|nr:ABC transporter substrate-binding protein [Mesorhizobium amorphae]GLR45280.1 peptide ABC transporter substrate-binding protein [Mesorhizobium amorphae]
MTKDSNSRTPGLPLSRRGFLNATMAIGIGALGASTLPGPTRAETPKKGGILKMGLGGGESTNNLDPAAAISEVPVHTLRAWGEPLLDINPDGTFDWRLAESAEPSKDAKTWAFKIRRGVQFHNGKTMTAEDVLATMRRHSDAKSKSAALGIMRGITDMKADGDNFIVTLAAPNIGLPFLMSTSALVIQPNGGLDNPGAGIGTNAYRVVENVPGVRYGFERFANYWDQSRGHFDQVQILVINDASARTAALQSGQVHIISKVSPKIAHLLKRAPGVEVKNVTGRAHYVFVMLCDTAPFDNNDLRMALKLAIDREEMVDKVLAGYGKVGNDFPINAAYPDFDDTIPQRTFDPVKAAEYYKKSGHDGSPIILRVSDVAFPGAVDAAQLFQQSAAKAGIPLQIKQEPGDGYWSEVWDKQPFCATYWGGRPTQDQMYSTVYLSTADWNETHFKNKKFDELLVQARGEFDDAKRKALYKEMDLLVRDEGGTICPMFNDYVEGIRSEVKGWEANSVWELMNGLAPHKCWFG